ncbi:MAG: hypothetical protein U0892_15035 [Pirellulales bacterium]
MTRRSGQQDIYRSDRQRHKEIAKSLQQKIAGEDRARPDSMKTGTPPPKPAETETVTDASLKPDSPVLSLPIVVCTISPLAPSKDAVTA